MKSRGIGDTIAKITQATGIKQVVEKVTAATGKECGCKKRQQELNNPDLLINKTFYKN
jgi:glycerol dehydrogenase-like iron-containing ADH family enzyme